MGSLTRNAAESIRVFLVISYWQLSISVNSLTNHISHHIETSQSVCISHELTSFYMAGKHWSSMG